MENQPKPNPSLTRPDFGEMSLADIVDGLKRGKRSIMVCAALGTAISAVLLFAQRSYIAEAQFLPPSAAEVEPLNVRSAAIAPLRRSVNPFSGQEGALSPVELGKSVSEALTEFTPGEVYAQFIQRLQSQSLHRRVLEEQGILGVVNGGSAEDRAAVDEAFQEWEEGFSLSFDSDDSGVMGFVHISQTGTDSEEIAAFLNRVGELASAQVLENLKRVVVMRIANRRSEIATVLANERVRARSTRLDEIIRMEEEQAVKVGHLLSLIAARQKHMEARKADQVACLKEALAIAENAGMEDPLPGLSGTTSFVSLGGIAEGVGQVYPRFGFSPQTKVDINAQPLFFRGSRMLKAEMAAILERTSDAPFIENLRSLEEQLEQVLANPELEALRSRASDDPFIQGLRELEIEDQTLGAIVLPTEGLAAVTFDQGALPPRSPMKGWSYLFPGLLLGLVFGVILALLQRVLNLQRTGGTAA